MGSFSIWHWLVVLCAAALLFGGKGKITSIMGDVAKGIKAFKSGMKEPTEEETAQTNAPQVTPPVGAASVGVADRARDHRA